MKRDDIIGQKLFETCKLSEFYLNLIVGSKAEDESPLQLANAFTRKLYEIVERYDRLLDASKQREQFTLSFDHSRVAAVAAAAHTPVVRHKPPLTPNIPLGRCSTPNKPPGGHSSTLLSSSSTPSDSPSTPNYLNSFFRKSNSSLSLNKHWNLSGSQLNLSRKQSHKHYYTRQLAAAARAHSDESGAKSQAKLCQRIASIYYGSESEEDETNELDSKYDMDQNSAIGT